MKRITIALAFLAAFNWHSLGQSVAEYPQSRMEVVLLGTGYPRPDPDRAGPSMAVIVHGKYFIVDAGRAVVLRLSALQRPIPPITAVLLTHLHSDHTSGLPDLFNSSWVMGRKQPLQLYGPRGTQEMVSQRDRGECGCLQRKISTGHRPVEPAFGYRFESGGKIIAISGDTAPTDNLVKFARAADIGLGFAVAFPAVEIGTTDRARGAAARAGKTI